MGQICLSTIRQSLKQRFSVAVFPIHSLHLSFDDCNPDEQWCQCTTQPLTVWATATINSHDGVGSVGIHKVPELARARPFQT
ncbi:hypothetical protein J6590_020392 [Homalodisca vitripennis]|nr:hypothetical protein J6590_020392 [Homalodisca vitripennis]